MGLKCVDCLKGLKELPERSVDAVITDPPYGLDLFSCGWDEQVPATEVWAQCLRVLKPGGFMAYFSGTRDDINLNMVKAVKDAGFDIGFSALHWIYNNGFPKGTNISRKIDSMEGAEPTQIKEGGDVFSAPTTDLAKAHDGEFSGYQPKPSWEPIHIAMRPREKETITEQAIDNGLGVSHLDEARIPYSSKLDKESSYRDGYGFYGKPQKSQAASKGRFPANLLMNGDFASTKLGDDKKFYDLDAWYRNYEDMQTIQKPDTAERNKGLQNFERKKGAATGLFAKNKFLHQNTHPSIKPVKLMSYLITLFTRRGMTVCDPFTGSGTTMLAAHQLGREFVGFELNAEYAKIAEARLKDLTDNAMDKWL